MGDFIEENCGIALAHTLDDIYPMIRDLQHRGKDSCGIAGVGDETIDMIKWAGRVENFDLADLDKMFPAGNKYHTFLAHVRYSTKGSKDLTPAHPHAIGGEVYDRGSHVIRTGCDAVIVHNGQVNPQYLDLIDKGLLETECDTEALLHFFLNNGERAILSKIPGSYTAIIADKRRKDVIFLRDRTGIKPGVLGKKSGKYIVASEDIAFRKNGAVPIRETDPGCVYYFHPDGTYTKEQIIRDSPHLCFFEFNYNEDRDTITNGRSIREIRRMLGEKLGEEFLNAFPKKKLDFVTYLPRTPEPAAGGFAKATGVNFMEVFYKMKSDRAFMGASQTERESAIRRVLNLIPGIEKNIRGKRGAVIDDSGVRGTNGQYIRELLYDVCGVDEATYCLYTPPIGVIGEDGIARGCEFGVDMPPNDDFMARKGNENRSLEEIAKFIGMPVFYISKKGMLEVFSEIGIKPSELCTYCIGGERPFW